MTTNIGLETLLEQRSAKLLFKIYAPLNEWSTPLIGAHSVDLCGYRANPGQQLRANQDFVEKPA